MNPIASSMLLIWFSMPACVLHSIRMLFSNIMAKTTGSFAERRTAPAVSEGAVFIYGEDYDMYVGACILFLDDALTDLCEPIMELRSFPRIPPHS